MATAAQSGAYKEHQLAVKRLEGFVAHLNAGVLLEDEHRRILFVNQYFCDTFAITAPPEQLIGLDCTQSAEQSKILFKDPHQFVSRIQHILSLRVKLVNEPLQMADGRLLERDYVPIFVDDIYRGHYWVYRDITYHQQIREALEESRNRALALTKMKSQLLAQMSHEIRTPLNGVMGMMDMLRDTKLDTEQSRLVNNARSCALNLLDLLNDILDFSKLEAGGIKLKMSSVSLQSLIDHCGFIFEVPLSTKGLTLRTSIDPGLPPQIVTDSTRVRQILVNLVSNAIKFTERGEIHIQVTRDGTQLAFAVRDTGIGIDAEDLTQIFSPYVQAKSNHTGQGTGLGLAICRDLAQALGGDITAESTLGQGSCFRFHIRLEAAAPPSATNIELSGSYSFRGHKVLLVDDNRINQEIARNMLRKMGFEVEVAASGEAAVSAARHTSFTYIFMDYQLPGMDGCEATREIRKTPGHQPIIIALTASTQDEDRQRCLAAGMNGFLSKPMSRESILRALASTHQAA
jgi:signal transduction histidine kinase